MACGHVHETRAFYESCHRASWGLLTAQCRLVDAPAAEVGARRGGRDSDISTCPPTIFVTKSWPVLLYCPFFPGIDGFEVDGYHLKGWLRHGASSEATVTFIKFWGDQAHSYRRLGESEALFWLRETNSRLVRRACSSLLYSNIHPSSSMPTEVLHTSAKLSVPW